MQHLRYGTTSSESPQDAFEFFQSENEIFDVLIATGTSVSTSFTAEKLTTVISTDFTFSVLDAVQLWQRPSRHERSNEPLLFILHNDQALSAQFELLQQKRAPHSLFTVYDGFTADENKYLNRLLGIQSYDLFIKVLQTQNPPCFQALICYLLQYQGSFPYGSSWCSKCTFCKRYGDSKPDVSSFEIIESAYATVGSPASSSAKSDMKPIPSSNSPKSPLFASRSNLSIPLDRQGLSAPTAPASNQPQNLGPFPPVLSQFFQLCTSSDFKKFVLIPAREHCLLCKLASCVGILHRCSEANFMLSGLRCFHCALRSPDCLKSTSGCVQNAHTVKRERDLKQSAGFSYSNLPPICFTCYQGRHFSEDPLCQPQLIHYRVKLLAQVSIVMSILNSRSENLANDCRDVWDRMFAGCESTISRVRFSMVQVTIQFTSPLIPSIKTSSGPSTTHEKSPGLAEATSSAGSTSRPSTFTPATESHSPSSTAQPTFDKRNEWPSDCNNLSRQ